MNDERRSFGGLGVFCAIMALAVTTTWGMEPVDKVQKLKEEAREALKAADPIMGDWQGTWTLDDASDSGPAMAQVIALGNGKYRIRVLPEFNTRLDPIAVMEAKMTDSEVKFSGSGQTPDYTEVQLNGRIKGKHMTGTFQAGGYWGSFKMAPVVRISPTLGAKPPKGAVVLFNGKNLKKWMHPRKPEGQNAATWKLVDGAMEVKPKTGSIISKRKFEDIKLHLEFRTPFMPEARGQGRGNSGVYIQGRYECQILDSYGLQGKDNECGGVYKVGAPIVNMCAPPRQWQTYDITFRAPKFDSDGKKVEDARMSVVHNGVLIQDNIKIPGPTTASLGGDIKEPAGIYLQDHGNPVQYRNIWVVELE